MIINKKNAEATISKINHKEKVPTEEIFVALRYYESQTNCKSIVSRLKDLIVSNNPGLLMKYKVKGRNLFDDCELLSEINLTVARAINSFDVMRGIKWSTYLCFSLEKAVWRAYRKTMSSSHPGFIDRMYDEQIGEKESPLECVKYLPSILETAELTDVERQVINGRYLNNEKKTLDYLGEIFHVSRESIRNYEKKAMKKLKAAKDKVCC